MVLLVCGFANDFLRIGSPSSQISTSSFLKFSKHISASRSPFKTSMRRSPTYSVAPQTCWRISSNFCPNRLPSTGLSKLRVTTKRLRCSAIRGEMHHTVKHPITSKLRAQTHHVCLPWVTSHLPPQRIATTKESEANAKVLVQLQQPFLRLWHKTSSNPAYEVRMARATLTSAPKQAIQSSLLSWMLHHYHLP